MKISFICSILLMLFLSLDDVAAEDNTNAALNNVSAEIGNLSASIGNASATKDNMTQQQPLKVNDTTEISITKLDEKIIAGNNFTIFLDINSSKEGNLNISLQRDDFKLTFYNQSRVGNNRRQYTINITSPANLDNGLYELSAELNGVKKSQYIFVDKKIVNIFKDKINSTPLIELMVVILIALLLIYFLIANIGIHRAIFLAILVVGCLLILSFIFLDIQKIPFLNLPTYVLVYSFIGALGYVCISWFKGAEILDPEIKKIDKEKEDRYRKWSSRLTAAPIIGIIIYFGANTIFSLNLVNDNAIAGLCLISGLFIKPILIKSRETIFKLLAPNELIKDDLKELDKTDLVELLGSKHALDLRACFKIHIV